MILQDHGEHLSVIRQTDHAMLSGFLAREWGNGLFRRPDLFESFCVAVREHDNGWCEWELLPRLDPKTHIPYTFMSVPTEEHIALYQRGIERLASVDRYAALLVSLHCTALYDRSRATIPGYSAKYVKSTETQVVNEFLQQLKLQQLRLKVDLRANPTTKNLAEEKSLERNLGVLEALDRLSLYFCLNFLDGATVENVPLHIERETVNWELRPFGENGVTLSPYPFRRNPLSISILARRVSKREYADDLDFQKTLAFAPYFAVDFTLRDANEVAQNRSAVA
jgi:hypothetical protein